MKIVSWNIRNVGNTKLTNRFSAKFVGFGLGNDVGDYVAGLVTGSNRWNNVNDLSTNPADIFVVIELKTGGKRKGHGVSGTALPTLGTLIARMNTMINARYVAPRPYHYAFGMPLVIGYHECVGVIYNTVTVTPTTTEVQRDNTTNNFILPRSPFRQSFTINANNQVINIVGLHAPPPGGGGAALKYRPPIDYSNLLQNTNAAGLADTYFMGDFNTDPSNTYTNGFNQVIHPFEGFTGAGGYDTFIPNNTLSSVRQTVDNDYLPPENYMSDAFDNILFNAALQQPTTDQIVVDMIGEARDMNGMGTPNVSVTNVRLLLNSFNTVSDHMPVVIEF